MNSLMPTCQLIGAGRAGSALSNAMVRAGYRFTWIGSKHSANSAHLAEQIGVSSFGVGFEQFHGTAGFLIIAVPDSEIAHVASDAVAAGVISHDTIAAHLSGAIGSDVLHELRTAGASVMAFHPAQTLTLESDPEKVFIDICFDMEGDDTACVLGKRVAQDLGAVSVRLSPEQRIISHLAMTVASNYTVSVLYMAEEIIKYADIPSDTARRMLMPLVSNTVHNCYTLGTLDALTGPVSRGDIQVIKRHLDTLAPMKKTYQEVYKGLASIALQMTVAREDITKETVKEIRKILEDV